MRGIRVEFDWGRCSVDRGNCLYSFVILPVREVAAGSIQRQSLRGNPFFLDSIIALGMPMCPRLTTTRDFVSLCSCWPGICSYQVKPPPPQRVPV